MFSRLDSSDSIAYSSPSFSGFTVGLSHDEGAVNRANETNGLTVGLGVGAAGTPAALNYQRGTAVSVSYAGGPIALNANYKVWDQTGGIAGVHDSLSKNRISLAGAYDFGVAKLGVGFRNTQFVTGTRQDSFLAVGVPFGALTLGADWGARTQNDTANSTTNTVQPVTAGTRTGYGLKADYALSKRTSLILSYASWEAYVNVANRTTQTNLWVSHSF